MTVTTTLPKHHRKGINVDARAGQYVCRVGFSLTSDGRRVQAPTKYLSNDPDEATRRHLNLMQEWDLICADWARYQKILPYGLPETLRHADLSKPFWVKDEWRKAAEMDREQDAREAIQQVVQDIAGAAASRVDRIDADKAALAKLTAETKLIPSEFANTPEAAEVIPSALLKGNLLDALPADVRARVLWALQPSAAEVTGISPDAQAMTIRQVADKFLEHEKSRVGSSLRGITANSYLHEVDMVEGSLRLLDTSADIRTLTHERLMAFVIEAGKKAKSAVTAFNWCKHGLLPVLRFAHKNSSINYRIPDSWEDIFKLRRPHAEVRMEYEPDVVAKLIAIRTASERMRAESWVFVLLGLNCGAYQADIASWTYSNLKIMKDGKVFLEWQRTKEMHKGQKLILKHELWPETWARMQKYMAPDDPSVNPQRRLFLSRDRKPMWSAQLGTPRVDAIGLRYKRAVAAAFIEKDKKKLHINMSFKQLRKIGMNAMNQFGTLEIARVYAGHALPGVDAAYLVNRYGDMNTILMKWREQLLKDGVLVAKENSVKVPQKQVKPKVKPSKALPG